MLVLSFATNLVLNVILTIIHVIAITLTLFRLYYRTVTQRLWWDDLVAFLAVLGDFVYMSALWFAYAGSDSVLQTHMSLVSRYWLVVMLFLLVVWMTRISLALAIARIFPPGELTRAFAIGMAILSTSLCLVIIIQTSVVCSKQLSPKSNLRAVCTWPDSLRILVIVSNIVSDILLVATPLYKLWRVRLPRNQRRLILGGFTASAVTTSVTVACAVFQLAPSNWEPARSNLQGKLSYAESGISLIACNLLVVVTYFYMVFRRGEDLDLPDNSSETCESRPTTMIQSHSSTIPSTHLSLTQITDLDAHTTFADTAYLDSPLTLSRSTEHPASYTRTR